MIVPKHLPRWIKILTFADSRKVGFGIWLFIVANLFLEKGKIDAATWLKCAFVSGALIGFGSILDALIEKYFAKWLGATDGNPPTPPIA